MNKEQISAAKQALIQWLSHPSELGQAPKEIEYVNIFNLHNKQYYIFKFQKQNDEKWYTGVSGGYENDFDNVHCGHIYSQMKEFNEETAENDCIEMVEMIIEYWKKHLENTGFNQAFQQNNQFIHQEEIPVDKIKSQFENYQTQVGTVTITSGSITVADPLAYIPANRNCLELEEKIPNGEYKVYVSVCKSSIIGIRMCTVKMKITEKEPVKYIHAKGTQETAIQAQDDKIIHGFPVDASMISIIDTSDIRFLQATWEDFEIENPGKHFYEDNLAYKFKESYKEKPQYQREEGDFIQWSNPVNNNNMVMVASGLGDGIYYAYYGYDENNEICELIIPMVNPEYFYN